MLKIPQLIQYLESEKRTGLAAAEALAEDGRRDEANMARIRANIFDVMAAVSRTAQEKFPQNAAGFIREKMGEIPRNWSESLAAAERHGDHIKAMTERIKLQAMAEITAKYTDMAEGEQ